MPHPDPPRDPSAPAPEPTPTPAEEFNLTVAPILGGGDGRSGHCGPCHAVNGGIGPAFLLPSPDMLTSVLAYPGLIGDSPETSLLYTKGAHHGTPWLSGTEAAAIAHFVVAWNAAKEAPRGPPSLEPFVPLPGRNAIDLSPMDPALAGARLSFVAEVLGPRTAASMLELSRIEVWTSARAGLRIVHPLWSKWDQTGRADPDPADSFSNLDQTTRPSRVERLGAGLFILPGYAEGQRISVAFERIEAIADEY